MGKTIIEMQDDVTTGEQIATSWNDTLRVLINGDQKILQEQCILQLSTLGPNVSNFISTTSTTSTIYYGLYGKWAPTEIGNSGNWNAGTKYFKANETADYMFVFPEVRIANMVGLTGVNLEYSGIHLMDLGLFPAYHVAAAGQENYGNYGAAIRPSCIVSMTLNQQLAIGTCAMYSASTTSAIGATPTGKAYKIATEGWYGSGSGPENYLRIFKLAA